MVGLVLPMWYVQTHSNPGKDSQEPFNYLDGILAVIFITLLIIETVADQQQWNFQNAKYKWINDEKESGYEKLNKISSKQIDSFKRGFFIEGLFSYSRHPNFCAEISLWWTFYLFSISSQLNYLTTTFKFTILFNYTIVACLFLTCLFQGSTHLTEKITQSKYPEYAKYKARVSRLLPWFTAYRPKSNDSLKNENEETTAN